jgi:hypothetical protein
MDFTWEKDFVDKIEIHVLSILEIIILCWLHTFQKKFKRNSKKNFNLMKQPLISTSSTVNNFRSSYIYTT